MMLFEQDSLTITKEFVLMEIQSRGFLSERDIVGIFGSKGHQISAEVIRWIRDLPYTQKVKETNIFVDGKLRDRMYDYIHGFDESVV